MSLRMVRIYPCLLLMAAAPLGSARAQERQAAAALAGRVHDQDARPLARC